MQIVNIVIYKRQRNRRGNQECMVLLPMQKFGTSLKMKAGGLPL